MVKQTGQPFQSGHLRAPWASVELTPIEEADLDLVHSWQNDPIVRDLTMGFRLPLHRTAVRDWLNGLHGANQGSRAVYAIRCDGAAVGITQLFGMAPFQRRAEVGLMIGDRTDRGVGVGYVAFTLILDFAFNGLDLRKVGAEVLVLNRSVTRLCERMGFVREGLKRQEYFSDGACWDTVVFGILRDEFTLRPPPAARRLCATLARPGGSPPTGGRLGGDLAGPLDEQLGTR